MDATLTVVVAGAVVAGFVQGLSGFAFSMAAASIWAWAVPPQLTAPLLVFGSFVGQVMAIPAMRRGFSLRAVAPFLVGGLAGVPVGVAILPHVDPVTFRFGVGLFLMVYGPATLAASTRAAGADAAPRAANRVADGAVGFGGGILGGIAGMTGALPTLWCLVTGRDRHESRAVIQSFNLAMHAVTLAGHAATGAIGAEALTLFAIVAPAMLVPTLLGARLYRRLSDRGFRNTVLVLLTIAGGLLVAGSAPAMIGRFVG